VTDPDLPSFRYHPDPVATGAFERLSGGCRVCGQARGWLYVLGAYGPESLRDAVCPWCIADGSAAERCSVRFNVIGAPPPGVSAAVVEDVERRTPGFSGWQQERWLFHCDDAAAFLGAAGWEELEAHPDAEATVRADVAGWGLEPDDIDALVGSLDVDGSATAYLFRCLHCGAHLAYADVD
jgi:uncharacterized protein CbrC (UPF0167 family)